MFSGIVGDCKKQFKLEMKLKINNTAKHSRNRHATKYCPIYGESTTKLSR